MSRTIAAPVSPAALIWARETAGYPQLEDAIEQSPAAISKFLRERLAEWERGDAFPSVAQAKKLAKFYHRPLTDLYLRKIPQDLQDPEPPDFRRDDDRQPFSPNLRLLLRQAYERQRWAREFLVESPESGHFDRPSARRRADAEALGAAIRNWLGVDAGQLATIKKHDDALAYWTSLAEARGIIVMQSHRHKARQVSTKEFSGFAITDDKAPAVVLNSGDSHTRRIFTLIHEIAHLWIAAPGVSRISFNLDAFSKSDDEAYCNRTAAAALLPPQEFRNAWRTGQEVREDDETTIDSIANSFKASHSATAVRAASMQFISRRRCSDLLDKYKQLAEAAAKRKGGRALPDKQALGRSGGYLARLTLDAYEQGVISALDVGHLFGVKLDHLSKIARRLDFPLHRWAR